jgi:hypothetical protein
MSRFWIPNLIERERALFGSGHPLGLLRQDRPQTDLPWPAAAASPRSTEHPPEAPTSGPSQTATAASPSVATSDTSSRLRIKATVGRSASNRRDDVLAVQKALNRAQGRGQVSHCTSGEDGLLCK